MGQLESREMKDETQEVRKRRQINKQKSIPLTGRNEGCNDRERRGRVIIKE